MVGETLSHYRILSRIGSGAMGDVYKAEDIRLQRHVAVKLMAGSLARDAALKRRFMQEARAASALDHQNVCTVHDIGEAPDGRLFLVMAYYEGETLAARIRRGALPVADAASITRQIAQGLSRAHEYGIVHRDVKPGNVFLTRLDAVKILDFGLAKLRADLSETAPGEVLGTVRYMSPEQVACKPADFRTDIWSLGVAFYEMLAGRCPFDGDCSEAIFYAILRTEPPPLAEVRPDAPPFVIDLVGRMLAKSPDMRVQSCYDIGRALARASTAGPDEPRRTARPQPQLSIMVLPFLNLAGDSETEYFGHGLADEITTRLSHVQALRVMAQSAAERVRAAGGDSQSAARELGVDHIVEGKVRRQGTALRVSANLTDARQGSILWAEQFNGTLDDIFSIQERISSSIVDALRIRFSPTERLRVATSALSDVEAYNYYLKAKQEFVRYAAGGLERALAYIEAARARVGDNVLLLAAAGQIYWQLVNSGSSVDRSYLDRARECAEGILELDRESPHGHRLQGMIRALEGDVRGAIALLERAAARDPNDTDTLSLIGPLYGYVGRPQSGMPYVARLLELDPLTPMYQAMPGILSMMAGSFQEALEPLGRSFRLDPGNPLVGLCYGQCLALNGQIQDATNLFNELQRNFPDTFLARLGQLYCCALLGRRHETSRWMSAEVEAIADWDLYHSWNLSECFALLGDADSALRWLTRATERGMVNYPLLSQLDPLLESVRHRPEFQNLMATVRRQWEDVSREAPAATV